jgi:hypothetical protein
VRSCGLKVVSFGPKFATSFKRVSLDHSAILWPKICLFWAKIQRPLLNASLWTIVRPCGLKTVSFGSKFATSFKQVSLDHSAILWSESCVLGQNSRHLLNASLWTIVRHCGLETVSFGPKLATSFKRVSLDHSAILWPKSCQFRAKNCDLF